MNSDKDPFARDPDPAFRRRAQWIARSLHREAPDGPRILDIGCGRGYYFAVYDQLGASATGVDADTSALAAARAAHPTSTFRQVQAECLPFDDNSFDVIVMSEVLEHMPDPALGLSEAARVLVPDGLLLATVPHAGYPFAWDPVNWIGEAVFKRHVSTGTFAGIWAGHERLYRPEELHQQVTDAGFDVIEQIAQTRWCLPFVHNLLYGLGKPMIEANLLPDVRRNERRRGPSAALIALARTMVDAADRLNGDTVPEGRPALNLCIAARKP
ncbi:class I SAM-dependent methyltransferase [Pelagovum pacificum]|uniref:class I SAM-dependent methyltransferase n=1 Tax=Pelagovum pacificum TaxID=2588711 RepID=UPI0018CD54C9|nr:class I SAM-dependent methyltransferase [Pelagovum pacificum]QQA44843.1 class I SAM-dependent methyltransferase [Pelagovum pacificum]